MPGVEGITGATLPPPGFWLRDYNVAYYTRHSERLPGGQGGEPEGIHLCQRAPFVWITDMKVLGGYLGLDALLPLQYTTWMLTGYHHQTFGIGDVFVEGTWSSHLKQFDLALGFGVWAPTGNSSDKPIQAPSTLAGLGYWTYMLTAGATWYIDNDKRWSVSALNRYEFSTEKEDTEQDPGQAYTLEWGVGYGVTKTVNVGAAGYYQQQVTPTSGDTWSQRDRVAGVGPEISAFFPQWMLGVSFRYAYEFMAENRFQGHTFALTLTKSL